MTILHYIHNIRKDDLLSDCLQALVDALKGQAGVYVITREDNYQQALDDHNPDIVHIHGCWDRYAYRLMKAAVAQGCAVVLSPHWEIGTYSMRHESHMRKLMKLADYQRWMVSHCEAIAVTTADEGDDVASLGWQRCIDVVGTSVLDSSISPSSMGGRMMWLYQKVVDTRYRRMLTPDEKEAVCSLVSVGISHGEKLSQLPSNKLLTLRSLKPFQWRRLLFYADDEDLRGIFDTAIERLQLSVPPIETNEIDRYPSLHPKSMGLLKSDRVIGKRKTLARKLREETENDPAELKHLSAMLINAHYLIGRRQMSMRQLAELFEQVKYADYDESRFVEITKSLRLRRFMRRLLSVMHDFMYLDEGFMPDKPADDRTTRRIRTLFI